MRRARHHSALLAYTLGLTCSLWNTHVLRAEDTAVSSTPQSARDANAWHTADLARLPDTRVESDYTLPLIASYVAAPLLGFGLTLGLAQFNAGEVTIAHVVVGVFGSGIAASAVHAFNHQPGLAFRAFFALPSLVIVSSLLGALLGGAVMALVGTPSGAEDPDVRIALGFGIAAGGVAAIAWAVFDVLDAADTSQPRHSHGAAASTLQFAFTPTEHGAAGLLTGKF